MNINLKDVQHFSIGEEKTPIVVIDNVLENIDDLRTAAHTQADFSPDTASKYPGVRAHLPDNYVNAIVCGVQKIFSRHFVLSPEDQVSIGRPSFSLITTLPEKLRLYQCIPHFDGVSNNNLAMVHYLGDGNFGGTGFFRHKPTKLERITKQSIRSYRSAVDEYFRYNGFPQARYQRDSDEHYELVYKVDYKPNRLVIYPQNILHSGLVSERDCNDSATSGRLTANIFVNFDTDRS